MAFSKNYITASEIGEYVYCPRGWWLRVNGKSLTTPQMIRGRAAHESLFSRITWTLRMKIIALLIIGIALLSIMLILKLLTGL